MTVVEAPRETQIVDGQQVAQRLREQIREYEQRYEITSQEMLSRVSRGKERETSEVLEWMYAYHVLQLLDK